MDIKHNTTIPQEIKSLYYQKLDSLSMAYELMDIETSFGKTNIVITGTMDRPPLVLLHGLNSCAPLAIEALGELGSKFTIYAIDIIGQPNLSEKFLPKLKKDTYGQWIYEILSRLNLWSAILVGISLGGFIAWKTLTFDQRRISKAFLIMPAGIVKGRLSNIFFRLCIPLKMHEKWKHPAFLNYFLRRVYTTPSTFLKAFLPIVFANYEMFFWSIPLLNKGQASMIKIPINIVAAQQDILFPGIPLLKRACAVFPNLEQTLLLKNSQHVAGKSENKQIVQFIINNYKK
ncbi:MAG: carboxylesterase [Saprospiraceae bacterium]